MSDSTRRDVLTCRQCGFASSCRSLGDRCPSDGTLLVPRATVLGSRRDPSLGRLVGGRFLVLDSVVQLDETTLYRGRDLATDCNVCIKVVPPYAVGADARVARLVHETRILRRASHSTLPEVIAAGQETDGFAWVVQTEIEGVTLRALLGEQQRLEPNRAINIMLRVLAALDRLHDAGYVLGDLRPEAIMVSAGALRGNDEVRLLDCGGAHHPGEPRPTRLDGTSARYRAPEQFAGHAAGVATDIYAAGALLFEMLAGRPPFPGRTPYEQMQGHTHRAVPGIGISPAFEALEGVVRRALAKAPGRRWRQARAMAIALKAAFVTGRGQHLTQSSAPPPARPASIAPSGFEPTEPNRRVRSARLRATWALLVS